MARRISQVGDIVPASVADLEFSLARTLQVIGVMQNNVFSAVNVGNANVVLPAADGASAEILTQAITTTRRNSKLLVWAAVNVQNTDGAAAHTVTLNVETAVGTALFSNVQILPISGEAVIPIMFRISLLGAPAAISVFITGQGDAGGHCTAVNLQSSLFVQELLG